MKINTIILTAIIAMFGLVGFGSDAFGEPRDVDETVTSIVGDTFSTECNSVTITAISGTQTVTEIEQDAGGPIDEMEWINTSVQGMGEDDDGCLYSISTDQKEKIAEDVSGGERSSIYHARLLLKPLSPSCGMLVHANQMIIETPSGNSKEALKFQCPSGGNASSGNGTIKETEEMREDLANTTIPNPCTGEDLSILSGVLVQKTVLVLLPNGTEKGFLSANIRATAVDGAGNVYSVNGNAHENVTADETSPEGVTGNAIENVHIQSHGPDGVSFHGTLHGTITPSGNVIFWDNLRCSDGSTPEQ